MLAKTAFRKILIGKYDYVNTYGDPTSHASAGFRCVTIQIYPHVFKLYRVRTFSFPYICFHSRITKTAVGEEFLCFIPPCSQILSYTWKWSLLYSKGRHAVAQWLRHCAANRKVAGSIPDGVTGSFNWHNPSGRTMALGSTQPLTEMSTRNMSWG
jgi:hypothetical protein